MIMKPTPARLALLALAAPAKADRWFGSVEVHCDSFAYCIVSPSMREPPSDPATLRLERSGKADAPLPQELVRVLDVGLSGNVDLVMLGRLGGLGRLCAEN